MRIPLGGIRFPFEASLESVAGGRIRRTSTLFLGERNTHREEIPHNPFKDSTQQQQHWPNEEEDHKHAAKTRRTTPTHHDHSEAERRDNKAHEAHRRWIGISLVRVSDMRDLGREVEFLEELGG